MLFKNNFIFKIFSSISVQASVVLQQANKGLVSLRHYVDSHNGRISDEVNYYFFAFFCYIFDSFQDSST